LFICVFALIHNFTHVQGGVPQEADF
jgi:hypothetical protein